MDKRLPNIEYHFLFAMDLPNQDLLGTGLLAQGLAVISNAIQSGGNVLVHCEVGVSRSVTVVAAYVMQKYKFSPEKALEFIKKSRPIAYPNEGFYAQLQIYEKLDYKLDDATLSTSRDYRECEVGVSRSVTVVAAYVMQKYKFSPEKALEFIKKSRPIA
ncbi:unnamed protein product [Strongylus vulgaris]|uniref:Protein-tyrosine-phosphatase n=1 Tax=Strongylus vulgaris TaxID=40348 RepID=A0A3P7JYY0_STRVU|nr:unnamed protein product [Strongylus vulgaris]